MPATPASDFSTLPILDPPFSIGGIRSSAMLSIIGCTISTSPFSRTKAGLFVCSVPRMSLDVAPPVPTWFISGRAASALLDTIRIYLQSWPAIARIEKR